MTPSVSTPSPLALVSRREIEHLVFDRVHDAAARLGFHPDIHMDWPPRMRVAAAVARALGDALDGSLALLAGHQDTHSAFVSVAWRTETVELCVVDDGRARRGALRASQCIDDVSGLEHEVDDYGTNGTCQWWSIPLDLC
jgi:hypothetical protein